MADCAHVHTAPLLTKAAAAAAAAAGAAPCDEGGEQAKQLRRAVCLQRAQKRQSALRAAAAHRSRMGGMRTPRRDMEQNCSTRVYPAVWVLVTIVMNAQGTSAVLVGALG